MKAKNSKTKGKASKKKQQQLLWAMESEVEVGRIQRLKELYPKRCDVFACSPLKDMKTMIDKALVASGSEESAPSSRKIDKILLYGSNFSAGEMWALTTTFQTYSHLTSISLWMTKLQEGAMKALSKFYVDNKQMTTLQLVDCNISDKPHCLPYIENIIRNSFNLTTLVLDHNPELGSQGFIRIFEAIYAASTEIMPSKSKENTAISDLPPIPGGHVAALSSIGNSNINNNPSNNNSSSPNESSPYAPDPMTPVQEELGEDLHAVEHTQDEFKESNPLGSDGRAMASAPAIPVVETPTFSLHKLSLRFCDANGYQCGESIQKALEKNKTITELDLRGNYLTNFGLLAIAQALRSNQTLKVLSLESNGICNEENCIYISQDEGTVLFNQPMETRDTFVIHEEGSLLPSLHQSFRMASPTPGGFPMFPPQVSMNSNSLTNNMMNSAPTSTATVFSPLCLKAFQTLSESVNLYCSLTVLNIRGNDIGNQAGTTVLEMLQSRKKLQDNPSTNFLPSASMAYSVNTNMLSALPPTTGPSSSQSGAGYRLAGEGTEKIASLVVLVSEMMSSEIYERIFELNKAMQPKKEKTKKKGKGKTS